MSAPPDASRAAALKDQAVLVRLHELMGGASADFIAGLKSEVPAPTPPDVPDPVAALDLALRSGFTPDALSPGTALHAWAIANSALLPGTAPRLLRITEACI